jgi:hypothetical protein
MSAFDSNWLRDYEARQKRTPNVMIVGAGPDRESDLHEEILAECRRRQWIAFHGSMAHKTFRTEGEPDFVILAHGGKMFLVEAKTTTGKLSPAQLGIHAWANKLGHEVHVVRSISEFLTLITNGKQGTKAQSITT